MHQLKARVFESMFAGALLFETRNQYTETIFTDGLEYVAFDNEKNLIEKINFYLDNPEKLKQIALRGRSKTLQCYTAEQVFDNVLDHLDLPRELK